MTTGRDHECLASLVRELCRLPHETEWFEFKLQELRRLGRITNRGTRSHSEWVLVEASSD